VDPLITVIAVHSFVVSSDGSPTYSTWEIDSHFLLRVFVLGVVCSLS